MVLPSWPKFPLTVIKRAELDFGVKQLFTGIHFMTSTIYKVKFFIWAIQKQFCQFSKCDCFFQTVVAVPFVNVTSSLSITVCFPNFAQQQGIMLPLPPSPPLAVIENTFAWLLLVTELQVFIGQCEQSFNPGGFPKLLSKCPWASCCCQKTIKCSSLCLCTKITYFFGRKNSTEFYLFMSCSNHSQLYWSTW